MNEISYIPESDSVNDIADSSRNDENQGYSEPLALFERKEEVYANCDDHDKRNDGQSHRLALEYAESRPFVFDFDDVEHSYHVFLHTVLVEETPHVLFGQQVRNQNHRDDRKFDEIQPPLLFGDLRPIGKESFDFGFIVGCLVFGHKNSLASDLRRNGYGHPLRSKQEYIFRDLLNTAVERVNRAAHKVEDSIHGLLIER